MVFTQESMDHLSRELFWPLMLLLDFGQFQYLATVYFVRRREFRVRMLLLASFIGFSTLVYCPADQDAMIALNDVSETCSQLTFLIQITITGHAVRAKVKLRSITWFTFAAEALILLDWINMVIAVMDGIGVSMGDGVHTFSNVVESLTLTFVLVFRFFYLSLSRGFRRVLSNRKLEFFFYILMVTHEYPFVILKEVTGISWEYVQGIYMRSTIVTCVLLNLHRKVFPSGGSRANGKMSTGASTANDDGGGRSPSIVAPANSMIRALTKSFRSTKVMPAAGNGPAPSVLE